MKVTWGLLSKNLEKYVYEPRTTRNKRLEPNMASGLSCSLLGLCCVCQAAFEDPFEEDRCLCVFVGLIFPVVACQLCFAGASGWRGGTILREGLSCHSCFACLYTWQAASEDFSFKKEDQLLCIDCPCGFVVPRWPSAAPVQAHHMIEEEARAL